MAASSNYALAYTGDNLNVTAATLSVLADPQSRAYGAPNPTLTYVETGLVNGDALTGALATTATITSVVGSYAITQGTLAASSNYALTYIGADLIVTPAPVVDVAQSVLFPSSFSTIVVPGNDNNASANLLSDSSACAPEEVWKRLHRYGRVELTGRNVGSCQ